MSYFDPLYPKISATRKQIQRSILALQDKLRLRKQIDQQILMNNNERLVKQQLLAAYQDELCQRNVLAHYDQFYQSQFNKDAVQRLKYASEKELGDLKHLLRMEKLQKQRLQLSKQREKQRLRFQLGKKNRYLSNSFNEQDDSLIRKYQDGTKARQYKNDIQLYEKNKKAHNQPANNFRRANSQYDKSPYNHLQYSSQHSQKKGRRNKNLYDNQIDENEKQLQNRGYYKNKKVMFDDSHDQYKPKISQHGIIKDEEQPSHLKSILKNSFNSNIDRKTHQGTHQKSLNEQEKDRNLQKFAVTNSANKQSPKQRKMYKRFQSSNTNKNHKYRSANGQQTDRSSKKLKESALWSKMQRSKYDGPPQTAAMQKIRNRLKVSSVVFRDSKLRNVKHELSHLFNTYDCQFKLRKEMKEKIIGHPLAQKSYIKGSQ